MLLNTIKAKLISSAIADTTTWQCYIGFAPSEPDQLISLHMTGGFPQDTLGGENVDDTFQLHVRAACLDYATCEAKARAALNALHDANLSSSSIYLIQAMAMSPLEYYDGNKRPNMTVNFRVKRAKP